MKNLNILQVIAITITLYTLTLFCKDIFNDEYIYAVVSGFFLIIQIYYLMSILKIKINIE